MKINYNTGYKGSMCLKDITLALEYDKFYVRRSRLGYFFNIKMLHILLSVMLISILTISCKMQQVGFVDALLYKDFENIEAPLSLTETNYQFEKLYVEFDAAVVIPTVTIYPVALVDCKVFSDQDLLRFAQFLTGTTKIYSNWEYNKKEWLHKLTLAKQYEGTEWVTQEDLAEIQEKYESSPVEAKNQPTDITEFPLYNYSRAYIKAKNGRTSSISFIRNFNLFTYFRDADSIIYTESEFTDNQFDTGFESKEYFLWRSPDNPLITRDAAYEKAQKCLETFGVDLQLYSEELCSIISDQVNKKTGWMFTFTRSIEGLQSQFEQGWIYINPSSLPKYVAPWGVEFFRVAVDKDGLCMVWWSGASKIREIKGGSVALLEFDEIQENIVSHLNSVYGMHDNGSGGLDLEITKIELGAGSIYVDSNMDIGVYIPVWFVTFNKFWRNSNENLGVGQILLNAIDGTYIEPRITYAELEEISSRSD